MPRNTLHYGFESDGLMRTSYTVPPAARRFRLSGTGAWRTRSRDPERSEGGTVSARAPIRQLPIGHSE